MTCIAGIADGHTVWIGGDSAGVEGFSLTVRADVKVFRAGDLVIGFTSSFRMGDILRYQLDVPARGDGANPQAYLVRLFIPAVRQTLKTEGWLSKDKEREAGGTFLIGCAGRLFFVGDDFQVGEAACHYDAVGCGHDLAKGALFASALLGWTPEERIRMALEAAAKHSAGVRGPFTVIRLEERDKRTLKESNAG